MPVGNSEVADVLDRVADLMDVQHADGFRVRAYRRGAQTCRAEERPLRWILEEGDLKALEELPGIGKSLAVSIAEYLHTGRLRMLERLEAEVEPEDLFTTIPGIGEALAHRIREELGPISLEELEAAAHDGRLAGVFGFGERRAHAVRDVLAQMLGRTARERGRRFRQHAAAPVSLPSIEAILEVDAAYRRDAAAGRLRRIAPRRFNPGGEAWLPILHASREGWFFTAMYSNSARAHRLGTTRDWVIVIYERDGVEGQATIVTEHAGPLAGRRVVRGRETECAA
ncbi:MAG: helix-hairpin-helix domain-containing protein [Planctomycetota bacterium]